MPLLLTGRLLFRDGGATWSLTRASVGVRSLSANGQRTAMPQPAVAADVHQSLDVHLHSLAQVAFDLTLSFQDAANTAQLVFTQVANARIDIDTGFLEHRARTGTANTVNISETNLGSLVWWQIDSSYTCHFYFSLSLSLFMLGIDANHSHHAFAMDDLALVAHLLYRRTDFHLLNLCLKLSTTCIGR